MNALIEVKGLIKSYKGNPAPVLRGIDLNIMQGEFFGLLGPNAAGKTTLISAMCGLLKVTEGSVMIKGLDVNIENYRIRHLIGLIPQDIALYPTLTVLENFRFFGQMYGLKRKELSDRIEACLSLLKLHPHAGKRVANCSGGIKRRANLMCGLIHEPEIIFLDEPTLGVDAQSMNLIYEYLGTLNKSGKTIIFTTHYMREAESLFSRVTVIDDGQIIANGTPAALIKENEGCRDLGDVFLKLTGKELRDS
jgi:ABC-2 type transport system ATP-binding protein